MNPLNLIKDVFSEYLIEIIILLVVGLGMFSCSQTKKVNKLESKIEQMNEDWQASLDKQALECTQNCMEYQRGQRVVNRRNGCYEGVELMCHDIAKKPFECIERLNTYCATLGD